MHAHRGADAGTRRTSAGRIVERELALVHDTGHEPMLGAAEAVVEFLQAGTKLLGFDDVKAEQPVAQL